MHQSCAANPSTFSALVAYAVVLPGRRFRAFVVPFSPCWGFSVFVLPVVVVAVPCGPRGLVGVLLLALSLVPWPPGEGCGFVSPVSASFVFCLRGARLSYFADFDVVTYFGRFCGIFRVAECPLGGEICGM